MSKNLNLIRQVGFVPLIVLEQEEDAVSLAKALAAGGIPIAEVTFRTAAAGKIIARMAQEVPDILVGAGTVHTVAQAREAVDAGAEFIVTPGFQAEVVRWCVENQVDVVPGVVSPSDIEQAMCFGLHMCKFFPAEAYGGVSTLKALMGPYRDILFMPTGGVNESNMLEYLRLSNVAAVGGSFTCPETLVKEKKWNEITALCQRLVQKRSALLYGSVNTQSV